MAANGFGPGAPQAAPGQIMVSIARSIGAEGFVRYTCAGSIDGLTRMTMDLSVFGDIQVDAFLATVAKTIHEHTSRIVRPT